MINTRGPRFATLQDPRMRAALYHAQQNRKARLSASSGGAGGTSAQHWRINQPDSAFSADLLAAEIVLLDASDQILTPVSGAASSTYQGTVASLWDNDVNTFHYWNDDSDNGTGFVSFDYGSDVTPKKVRIQAYNTTPERAPTSWTLQHSSDGTNWTDVMTITGEAVFTTAEARTYDITGD